MLCTRLIAVVLWADGQVVQTRRFRITNAVGRAVPVLERLCAWGVDEIALLQIRPGSGWLADVAACREICDLPLTVGGGVRSIDDVARLFNTGADMIVVRTLAGDVDACERIASRYGCQALVQSLDVGVVEHPILACAGEVIVNSLNHDGGRDGYDIASLQRIVVAAGRRPVVSMGGASAPEHFLAGLHAGAEAVAAGNLFHYSEHATKKIKASLAEAGVLTRPQAIAA